MGGACQWVPCTGNVKGGLSSSMIRAGTAGARRRGPCRAAPKEMRKPRGLPHFGGNFARLQALTIASGLCLSILLGRPSMPRFSSMAWWLLGFSSEIRCRTQTQGSISSPQVKTSTAA